MAWGGPGCIRRSPHWVRHMRYAGVAEAGREAVAPGDRMPADIAPLAGAASSGRDAGPLLAEQSAWIAAKQQRRIVT